MVISRVAHRYAEAIYSSIPEEERQAFITDVNDLKSTLENSRELQNFFLSPVIERKKKRDVVDALSKENFGTWMQRILVLLVAKSRESHMAEILEAILDLHRKHQGIQTLTVSTAVDLDDKLRQEIEAGLEQYMDSKVEIDYKVDAQLLGGVIVRKDDTVYDGSTQHHLMRLRRQFQAPVKATN
jgi:F-type H+-transporting ATPase subunit delta